MLQYLSISGWYQQLIWQLKNSLLNICFLFLTWHFTSQFSILDRVIMILMWKNVREKISFFLQSRYLSCFWIFWSEIFSKCLTTYHILIIWWKIHVLLTKNLPPQIWLSPKNLEKFSHRRCYLLDSQSSTDQISVVFAVFHLKFSWNVFICDIFWWSGEKLRGRVQK